MGDFQECGLFLWKHPHVRNPLLDVKLSGPSSLEMCHQRVLRLLLHDFLRPEVDLDKSDDCVKACP